MSHYWRHLELKWAFHCSINKLMNQKQFWSSGDPFFPFLSPLFSEIRFKTPSSTVISQRFLAFTKIRRISFDYMFFWITTPGNFMCFRIKINLKKVQKKLFVFEIFMGKKVTTYKLCIICKHEIMTLYKILRRLEIK